ncbi:MAG: Na+/H+ antiporter subunit E [Acidimicrobiia bacterium]|nr:Na+/H+ antiporter subunit E [Acidimicrobiia bacterium]
MQRLITLVWLVAVWVMLWESLSWANLLGGVAVAIVVMRLVPSHRVDSPVGFRPVAFLRLISHFVGQLVVASAKLSWEIFTPRNTINPAVVTVQLTTDVGGILAMVANMVSLIPGTVTLDADLERRTLTMHVLHLTTLDAARDSVATLEQLALAAFPPAQPPVPIGGSR